MLAAAARSMAAWAGLVLTAAERPVAEEVAVAARSWAAATARAEQNGNCQVEQPHFPEFSRSNVDENLIIFDKTNI